MADIRLVVEFILNKRKMPNVVKDYAIEAIKKYNSKDALQCTTPRSPFEALNWSGTKEGAEFWHYVHYSE